MDSLANAFIDQWDKARPKRRYSCARPE